MKWAAIIARVCPGFGSPLDLQVDEFDDALAESVELMKQWARL